MGSLSFSLYLSLSLSLSHARAHIVRQFALSANYRGLIWTASTLGYLVGTPIAGMLAAKHADSKSSLIAGGLALMGLSLPLFAAAPRSWNDGAALALATASLVLVGVGMALVDVPCQPLLADVADYRQLKGYGVVFAIADISASLGFMIGPLLGGALTGATRWLQQDPGAVNVEFACVVFAVGCVCVAPFVPRMLVTAERATSRAGGEKEKERGQDMEMDMNPAHTVADDSDGVDDG